MEAREFRLGNYFMSNIVQQIGIEHLEFLLNEKLDHSVMKLIPLTEEWLLKFGFEKEGHGFKEYWHLNDFEIEIHGDRFPLRIWGGESAPHLTQFIGHRTKHVHELQNLYYALTGEELTIKH